MPGSHASPGCGGCLAKVPCRQWSEDLGRAVVPPPPGNSESAEVPARLPEVGFQLQHGAVGSRASVCLNLHICKMETISQLTCSGCSGWRHERGLKCIAQGHISPWHVVKCSVRLGDSSLSYLAPPPRPGSVSLSLPFLTVLRPHDSALASPAFMHHSGQTLGQPPATAVLPACLPPLRFFFLL